MRLLEPGRHNRALTPGGSASSPRLRKWPRLTSRGGSKRCGRSPPISDHNLRGREGHMPEARLRSGRGKVHSPVRASLGAWPTASGTVGSANLFWAMAAEICSETQEALAGPLHKCVWPRAHIKVVHSLRPLVPLGTHMGGSRQSASLAPEAELLLSRAVGEREQHGLALRPRARPWPSSARRRCRASSNRRTVSPMRVSPAPSTTENTVPSVER